MKKWLTQHEGFGFACSSVIPDEKGGWRRCGAKTHSIQHIGGNDIQIPLCKKCLKARRRKLVSGAEEAA